MKKSFIITLMLALVSTLSFGQNASQARSILDKAASVIGRKGGATANFSISGKYGNSSGTIAIKGNKFRATTPDAIVWYDGKTEWTYIKKNEEVNVSTPTEAQQQAMNPYKFITIYKNGFNLSMTSTASDHKQAHQSSKAGKDAPTERLVNHQHIQFQGCKPERCHIPLQL